MSIWRLLFAVSGRVGRVPFVFALVGVGLMVWLGIRMSEAALPWLAQVLAPRGINAGFALHGIWLALGALGVWSAIALMAKRLHDRGRSGVWAAAGVLPLAALALVNDAIFLVSRSFILPATVQYAVLGVAGGVMLWVLWECAQSSRAS